MSRERPADLGAERPVVHGRQRDQFRLEVAVQLDDESYYLRLRGTAS